MTEFFTPADIQLHNRGELPSTVRSFNRMVLEQGWRNSDKARRAKQKGDGWVYHISLLPATIQARIKLLENKPEETHPVKDELWTRYEKLSAKQKEQCETRLNILQEIETNTKAGMNETSAISLAAQSHGVSASTIFNWKSLVSGVARANWKAALAPNYSKPREARTEVNEDLWNCLKSDYLRPEKPSFSACCRRVAALAEEQGWGDMPNSRTLRRKLNAEVPREVQVLAREGKDVAKTIFPAQRRTRAHMHAMQAVNMDGHKLDVFVRMNDGSIGRLYLIALQDLFSNKFVGWRLSHSENKETVRLCIGDMVEKYGIPEEIYLDNGRSFASKWITGGMKTRYRFKIREEEPQGLLTTLGVNVHWTTPYSGQSKPIERAFKDLCDTIAKHPFCAGAYTGNSPTNQPDNYGKRAVDEDLFRDFVDTQIRLHNAREDRNTENAKGISFDQAFMRSVEAPGTIIRWPSQGQKSLWLLAADQLRAKKGNGEIALYGNRYWAPALSGYAGKTVTARFDPDKLRDGLRVYDIKDQYICDAELIEDSGFDDVNAARKHSANRNQYLKLMRQQEQLHVQMTADELARLYSSNIPEAGEPVRPSIPRIASAKRNGNAQPVEVTEAWDEEVEKNFSAGLRLVAASSE